jgi:hypothetical protein
VGPVGRQIAIGDYDCLPVGVRPFFLVLRFRKMIPRDEGRSGGHERLMGARACEGEVWASPVRDLCQGARVATIGLPAGRGAG